MQYYFVVLQVHLSGDGLQSVGATYEHGVVILRRRQD